MAGFRGGETRDEAVPEQRAVPRPRRCRAGTGEAQGGASCAGFASRRVVPVARSRASMAGCKSCPRSGSGQTLERRQRGELTPLEVATRRRNRRWMGLVLAPSLVIGAVALIVAVVASSGRPVRAPGPGAVRLSGRQRRLFCLRGSVNWSQSSAYTDDVGDLDTQGQSGWAAEHVGARASPPSAGETPPTLVCHLRRAAGRPVPDGAGDPDPGEAARRSPIATP